MRRASAYRVFLTRNSEYHVRGHVCIGVRDRRTGQWQAQHPALSRPLSQVVTDSSGHLQSICAPALGDPLEFDVPGKSLRTSPILDIEEREALHAGEQALPSPVSHRPDRGPRVTR
ncbi:MAG TPA: hypothetical protein VF331_17680 [Polyangiales bacterium]